MTLPILEAKKYQPRIYADERGLKHRELTKSILGIFYDVYNELGYGFLESVYESALFVALEQEQFRITRQVPMQVWFRSVNVGDFRADLLVNDCVIIEIKAARVIEPAHEAQLLNYLRYTNIEVGLLLNFGPKPAFRRMAFSNERKGIRVDPR